MNDTTKALVALVATLAVAVAVIIVAIGIRANTTDEAGRSTTVCVLKLFHDLSQSSDKSPEQRKAAFDASFTPENLRTTCALTDREIALVLAPPAGAGAGTTTTSTP